MLTMLGQDTAAPKEFDDPSVVCTNLLTDLRAAGFSAPTFPVTKLYRLDHSLENYQNCHVQNKAAANFL